MREDSTSEEEFAEYVNVINDSKIDEETVIPLKEYNTIMENYIYRLEKIKRITAALQRQLRKERNLSHLFKKKNQKISKQLINTQTLLGHTKTNTFDFIQRHESRISDLLIKLKEVDTEKKYLEYVEYNPCQICYSLKEPTSLYSTTCCDNAQVCSQCINNLYSQQLDFQTEVDGITIRENVMLEAKCPFCRAAYNETPWAYFK